jgi:predicted Zn finger-like uncharacterized protein
MILECPKCAARYEILDSALTEEGRKVRCGQCSYTWFQESPYVSEEEIDRLVSEGVREEDDLLLEEPPQQEEVEDIPESGKPVQDKQQESSSSDSRREREPLKTRLLSYMIGGGAFVLLTMAGLILFQGAILSSWTPSLKLYQMMGVPISMVGENLVIESLSAQVKKDEQGRDVLVLSGRIVNLTPDILPVPNMIATLQDKDGVAQDKWLIHATVDKVATDASFSFVSDYPAVPDNITSVYFTFDVGLQKSKKQKIEDVFVEVEKNEH